MIRALKRIPRPVALWLAGMSIGSVAAFIFVHNLVNAFLPIFAYHQLPPFPDFCSSVAWCAFAVVLAHVAIRLYMSGYRSIQP
jgi:hypothetical protein